jgi:hypothetical protein
VGLFLNSKYDGIFSITVVEMYWMAVLHMGGLVEAHEHLGSPIMKSVDLHKHATTLFLDLLRKYKAGPFTSLRHELQILLADNPKSIVLVAYQAYFGVINKWNAAQVLARAREAPKEWISFVLAEDDDIFIGAPPHQTMNC